MRRKQHPLSGAIYEDAGDGRVRVSRNGLTGLFHVEGRYIEGEITQADLEMLVWVGGRELAPRRSAAPELVRD